MADGYTRKKERREKGSLFIPAGLFLGMGLGFLYNQITVGIFLGLGSGFIVYAITNLFKKRK